jgi:hypothetical protein
MSPAIFLKLVEIRFLISNSAAVAARLPNCPRGIRLHFAIRRILSLVMSFCPEVDLILVPMIAEEKRLAAVSDKDQGVVGKRHQGLLLR